MEKQELKNLIPEMVEELKSLGVEFETEFSLVYYDTWHVGNREDFPNECPFVGLQHILDKLPKTIECDTHFADYYLRIEWELDAEVCYMYYDHENMYDKEVKNGSFSTANKNPLLAAFELLIWVAINHPKSLTKTTE